MMDSEDDAKDTLLDLRLKKRMFRGVSVKGRLKSETVVRSFYPVSTAPSMTPIIYPGMQMKYNGNQFMPQQQGIPMDMRYQYINQNQVLNNNMMNQMNAQGLMNNNMMMSNNILPINNLNSINMNNLNSLNNPHIISVSPASSPSNTNNKNVISIENTSTIPTVPSSSFEENIDKNNAMNIANNSSTVPKNKIAPGVSTISGNGSQGSSSTR